MKIGKTARSIIWFLWENGASTERQIVDALRPPGRSDRWGNSYFLTGRGNGSESSLYHRGLIYQVGTWGRARLWNITPAAVGVIMDMDLSDVILTDNEILFPPLPDEFIARAEDDTGFPEPVDTSLDDENTDPNDFDPPDRDAEPGLADWIAARYYNVH